MRLSVLQIMLGTTPIVFLIAPTCLTGALLYMASLETDTGNPEFPWAGTVSTITASLTAVVQFGSMIVAAYYLEQTAGKRAAEVEATPDDREVKEADDKAAHIKHCYRDVTQWDVVPTSAKLLLQTSLACIITASYMVQLFSSLCFTPHSLTDSIDENLDGKVSNLFLPLGWVAVGLFCISIILIYLFESWGEVRDFFHGLFFPCQTLSLTCSTLFVLVFGSKKLTNWPMESLFLLANHRLRTLLLLLILLNDVQAEIVGSTFHPQSK